jgi:hypothetical protein
MSMVIPNHNVGRVFLEGEGEEGPELKGSVTAILVRFRREFGTLSLLLPSREDVTQSDCCRISRTILQSLA